MTGGTSPKARLRGTLLKAALVAATLYGMSACSDRGGIAGLAHGEMTKLKTPTAAASLPAAPFADGKGDPVSLASFKGKVVVLNLWATWCPPCVKEMPTLAKLQSAYASQAVKVVALSVDSANDTSKAKAFIAGNAPLDFYQDLKFAVPSSLNPPAEGFPTTLIYDRAGKLVGEMEGPADWAGADAKAVIDKLLKS